MRVFCPELIYVATQGIVAILCDRCLILAANASCRGKVERSVYILISRLGIKIFMELPVDFMFGGWMAKGSRMSQS